MSTLQTALRGFGKGVMALLAGIWARYLACLNECGLPDTKTKWAGFFLNWLPLSGMVIVGVELAPTESIGIGVAMVLNGLFVWPLVTCALLALVRRLQESADNVLLHMALAAMLVAIPLVVITTSVSAHPPSDQNHEADTVPNPDYDPAMTAEQLRGKLEVLTDSAASTVCGILLAKGLAVTLPITLPTGGGVLLAVTIGTSCGFVLHEVGGVNAIWNAVRHILEPDVPARTHPAGGGAYVLDSTCVALLTGHESNGPSADVLRQCSIGRHLEAHRDFEAAPAQHAKEKAKALAKAKEKLAEHVAVYVEYTTERLLQRGGGTSAF